MRRFWFLLAFGAVVCFPVGARTQEIVITVDATPPFASLRAFSEPTQITVSFRSSDGTPIQAGSASIALDAPPHGRIFSTDFPFVEGSRLFNLKLPIRSGVVRWEYLFPIRGEYQMTVEAAAGEKRITNSFAIGIREKEEKWLFLALFSGVLFVMGFVAGRIFTGTHRKNHSNAVALVALLWSLSATGALTTVGNLAGNRQIDINPAPVGELSRIQWTSSGAASANSEPNLSLRITHLEKQKTVFSIDKVPVAKEFGFDFQFTDGDEYRIEAVSEEKGALTRSERTISITAREPPMRASIPSLVFFVSVITGGLCVGRWTCYRKAPSS